MDAKFVQVNATRWVNLDDVASIKGYSNGDFTLYMKDYESWYDVAPEYSKRIVSVLRAFQFGMPNFDELPEELL